MQATGNDQTAGAAIGSLLGFLKSLTLISTLTWGVVIDTAILSAIGALVGYLVTTLLKYVKSKFKRS